MISTEVTQACNEDLFSKNEQTARTFVSRTAVSPIDTVPIRTEQQQSRRADALIESSEIG